MRDIKFRAWDKKQKRMVYDFETVPYFNSHVITNYSIKDCMQFTGLFDKNGKEIYEGDIVKFYDNWGRYYYLDSFTKNDDAMPIGVVRITTYKGVTCKFTPKRFTQFWEDQMTSGERPLKGEWNLSDSKNKWEVIGNIHENGSLLNDN